MVTLSESEWRSLGAEHGERVDAELAGVVERRRQGVKHPVDDFLFQYYHLRPKQLRSWHPGMGVGLAGAKDIARRRYHHEVSGITSFDSATFCAERSETIETALRLLSAAALKTPRYGCFGMHEWAMVHGVQPGDTRHPYLPLRFPPSEIARIVEEVGCRCSHIDAYRFFTPTAKPLNLLQPTREQQAEFDQPGCLHVNMDLYKWAGKLSPAVSASLLLETFLLARDIRVVDMQASAYDLSEWGLSPIQVETSSGRAEYVELQRRFAERATPLRHQLLSIAQELTDVPRVRNGHGPAERGGQTSGPPVVPQ